MSKCPDSEASNPSVNTIQPYKQLKMLKMNLESTDPNQSYICSYLLFQIMN